jgi:N-acetylglucosamine kinase-like BadF-type ATPase
VRSYSFTSIFRIFVNQIKFSELKYIIGIDSGATKSEVLIVKPLFVPVAQVSPLNKRGKSGGRRVHIFPPINFNVMGFDETAKRLIDIIKKASSKTGLKNIVYICAGISGARFVKDRKQLENKISKALKFKNIKIYPDTEIAFASIFEPDEKNCGILIAGTGSVLYYKNSGGALKKIGGWGRHFGDEGSGYWIAREALHKVTQSFDGRQKRSPLAKSLEKEFGLTSENIVKEIYHNNFEISKAAKLVFKSARNNDRLSKELITKAAEHLAYHFTPLGRKNIYQIALCGSLFTEEKLLEKELRKITGKNFKNIKLIKTKQLPVWGAVKLGRQNLETAK